MAVDERTVLLPGNGDVGVAFVIRAYAESVPMRKQLLPSPQKGSSQSMPDTVAISSEFTGDTTDEITRG